MLEKENIRRSKIARQPKLFRLIQTLRQLFQANMAAKNCMKRSTRSNAYCRKNNLLNQSIELARKISLPFFSWGIQLNPATPGYEIVVYFQFGSDPHYQVSFHTDSAPSCPEFKGKWNRIIASEFPFSVPLMRKLLKDNGISLTQLHEIESEEIQDSSEDIDLNDEVEERRAMRYCESESSYHHRNNYGYPRFDWDDDFDDDDFELRDNAW